MYKLFCFIIIIPLVSSFEFFNFNTINNLINSIRDVIPNKNKEQNILEDTYLNITQLVTKYGYEIEEHSVTTEDGYILNFHRMPARNTSENVIFLMHGILDSSDSWVLQGSKNALAYYLVDEGFDVWLGNARGNKHSTSHTVLNNTQSDFWKFTWEEIGLYDLPAMIDYVLNKTKKDSIYYVGHSQGTTSFYVMNALKPEYNGKIKKMFSLVPVAWMSHAKSTIIKMFTPAYNILGYLNIVTYYSSTEFLAKMQQYLCYILPIGCDNLLQLVLGNNHKLIESSLMPVIFGHVPSTSSTQQIIHYAQLYSSGKFCRFDFGASENLVRYGQEVPPDYDLRNITVPIVFFYSSNDWLSDTIDVSILYKELPNVYNTYYLEQFNHVDYLYANVAKDLIYSNIVKEIRQSTLKFDQLNEL